MSEENVEVVRAFYERFARGDFDALAGFSDDFEFVTSPELPDAGTYRGDAGDKVVVAIFQRGNLRGSQTAVEGRWWQVVTLRGGEVAQVVTFQERAQALEAAGLSE